MKRIADLVVYLSNPSGTAATLCLSFVPQTVWKHLGVLTVGVKQLCLDRWGVRE